MQRRVPSTWFIIFLENFFENIILALFCFADSKRHQSAAIHLLQAIAFASLCHFISSTSFLLQSGMSLTLSCLNICHTSGVAAFPKRRGLGGRMISELSLLRRNARNTYGWRSFLLKSSEMTINFCCLRLNVTFLNFIVDGRRKSKKKNMFTRVCATVYDFFLHNLKSVVEFLKTKGLMM